MEIKRMLKVYNYVNDEKKPKVNLKFAMGIFALLVTGGALVAFFLVQEGRETVAAPVAESRTDYVGLSTEEIQAGQIDPALVEERWSAWRAAHPQAEIQEREEVRIGSVVVGYRVTYTEG